MPPHLDPAEGAGSLQIGTLISSVWRPTARCAAGVGDAGIERHPEQVARLTGYLIALADEMLASTLRGRYAA